MARAEQVGPVSEQFSEYLAAVERCVHVLPDAIDAYGHDTERFAAAIRAVSNHEDETVECARKLRATLAGIDGFEAGRVYLMRGELVTYLTALSEIATSAERVLVELDTIEPALGPIREGLAEMAHVAGVAFETLAAASRSYVRALATVADPPSLGASLDRVRRLETAADDLKDDCLRETFTGGYGPEALVHRELVLGMDAVPNTIEDAADHLAYMRACTV
ncbi:DUF47 domain-containing protein [Natronomonas sp. EA1]|uniref:DUF47 domain-containing protein n=1 Tax=Natronomonas sp. EA1 TaxID=3421655 RepID=UPI003EB972A7